MRWMVVVLLVGCGRIGFDPIGGDAMGETTTDDAGRLCALEDFASGFPPGYEAYTDQTGFLASIMNERVVVDVAANLAGYAGVSGPYLDLVGASVGMTVSSVIATTANAETYISAGLDSSNYYVLSYED